MLMLWLVELGFGVCTAAYPWPYFCLVCCIRAIEYMLASYPCSNTAVTTNHFIEEVVRYILVHKATTTTSVPDNRRQPSGVWAHHATPRHTRRALTALLLLLLLLLLLPYFRTHTMIPRIPKMNSRRWAMLAVLVARFGSRPPTIPPRLGAEAPLFEEGERVVQQHAKNCCELFLDIIMDSVSYLVCK